MVLNLGWEQMIGVFVMIAIPSVTGYLKRRDIAMKNQAHQEEQRNKIAELKKADVELDKKISEIDAHTDSKIAKLHEKINAKADGADIKELRRTTEATLDKVVAIYQTMINTRHNEK